MNDEDGHRIEAALQFGFEQVSEDCPAYRCTESQLVAFAKACERAGRAQAIEVAKASAGINSTIAELERRNEATSAELRPILDTEEAAYMTSQGYVRGHDKAPGKRWIKLADVAAAVSPGCKHPCAPGAEYVCECHRRMGNDFWFLPLGECLEPK